MEEVKEQVERDIEMFIGHFNLLLHEAKLPTPEFSNAGEMAKKGDTSAEYTYGPTDKTIAFTLIEDKCKLHVVIKRGMWNTTLDIVIDLYNPDNWRDFEKAVRTYLRGIRRDTRFGQEEAQDACEANNWSRTDNRQACKCGKQASYRIPDIDDQSVNYLCAKCLSMSEDRCVLCGVDLKVGGSSPQDLDRLCDSCIDKIINAAVVRRPSVLKGYIAEVAGELFKEINGLHMSQVVDQAVNNVR
jgi:hypothetical protein